MSYREIAVELYGERRVAEAWPDQGWMKARVRYRVRRSLELMNGGYRALVSGG